MTARLLAEIRTNREEMEAQVGSLVSRMDAYHAKREANHEMLMAKLDAHHERMRASVNAWRRETTACQEATETNQENMEANPEEIKPVAEHEEVSKEEAAVETGRALKKRPRIRHLAAGRRGNPKERTKGNGGSRKKLAAARRGMTHCEEVAKRKGRCR
jgi:hypothetical protein